MLRHGEGIVNYLTTGQQSRVVYENGVLQQEVILAKNEATEGDSEEDVSRVDTVVS